jgi:hypothetical protein
LSSRTLGLDALVVAATVLDVERMELELRGQNVELLVIGIIKGVPGHEDLLELSTALRLSSV